MTAKPTAGLGRGFGALIPDNFDNSILLDESERVQKLPISKLEAGKVQPRQQFDETALAELAVSIKNHGILQPLVVTPSGESYQIIAGERRWRAAKLAKLETVPAIVRTLKELDQLEIALIENVQRVDLSPLEQAVSVERLHEQFNLTYEQIAKRLGKAISTISNLTRLLQLPLEAQTALNKEQITEGHARAILAIRDWPEQQVVLLKHIVAQHWSVREAERFVASVKAGIREEKAAKARVDTETPQTKVLSKRLATPVHIRRMAQGGRLEITFNSDDDLERITKLLS